MLLPAALPAPARGGFTTRFGGVSSAPYSGLDLALHVGDDPADVAVNRARLAEAVGVLPGALVFAEQVHGCGVAVVEAAQATAVPAVDALVTAAPGLALVVLAADCLPVLLADQRQGSSPSPTLVGGGWSRASCRRPWPRWLLWGRRLRA